MTPNAPAIEADMDGFRRIDRSLIRPCLTDDVRAGTPPGPPPSASKLQVASPLDLWFTMAG